MGHREAVEGTVMSVATSETDHGTWHRARVATPHGDLTVTVPKAWWDQHTEWARTRPDHEPLVDGPTWLQGRRVAFDAELDPPPPCPSCGGTGHDASRPRRARRPSKARVLD